MSGDSETRQPILPHLDLLNRSVPKTATARRTFTGVGVGKHPTVKSISGSFPTLACEGGFLEAHGLKSHLVL